jgi:hypothetical protein
MTDFQATGEAVNPQKGTSSTLKNLHFFLFFVSLFALLDPDPDPDLADQNLCGSGATTLLFRPACIYPYVEAC